MEKQREEYEQKALKAIQRAENEKAEAQSKMEYLQVWPQMQVKKASITNLKIYKTNIFCYIKYITKPTRLPPYLAHQQNTEPLLLELLKLGSKYPFFPSSRGRCSQRRQSQSGGRGCVRSWKKVRVSWRRGRMSAPIRCYSCRATWRYSKNRYNHNNRIKGPEWHIKDFCKRWQTTGYICVGCIALLSN